MNSVHYKIHNELPLCRINVSEQVMGRAWWQIMVPMRRVVAIQVRNNIEWEII